jgi:hypothetical protein
MKTDAKLTKADANVAPEVAVVFIIVRCERASSIGFNYDGIIWQVLAELIGNSAIAVNVFHVLGMADNAQVLESVVVSHAI